MSTSQKSSARILHSSLATPSLHPQCESVHSVHSVATTAPNTPLHASRCLKSNASTLLWISHKISPWKLSSLFTLYLPPHSLLPSLYGIPRQFILAYQQPPLELLFCWSSTCVLLKYQCFPLLPVDGIHWFLSIVKLETPETHFTVSLVEVQDFYKSLGDVYFPSISGAV